MKCVCVCDTHATPDSSSSTSETCCATSVRGLVCSNLVNNSELHPNRRGSSVRDVVIFNAWPSHAVKAELQCCLARFARNLKSASSEDIVIEIETFGIKMLQQGLAWQSQQCKATHPMPAVSGLYVQVFVLFLKKVLTTTCNNILKTCPMSGIIV